MNNPHVGLNFAPPQWKQDREAQPTGGARGCAGRPAIAQHGGPCDQGLGPHVGCHANVSNAVATALRTGFGPPGSGWGLATLSACRVWVITATSEVAALNAEPRSCSIPTAGMAAWRLIVISSTDANMRRKVRRRRPGMARPFGHKLKMRKCFLLQRRALLGI